MEDYLKKYRDGGKAPVENTDEFLPVKGSYITRIDSAGRVKGIGKMSGEPYDFRTIKMQVADVVAGDKATNRFLDLIYRIDEKGTDKLLNDLFTAGIEVKANTDEKLDKFLETLKDKTLCVNAWKAPKMKKEGDEWVVVEPKEWVQKLKILKEFKGKKEGKVTKSKVPF